MPAAVNAAFFVARTRHLLILIWYLFLRVCVCIACIRMASEWACPLVERKGPRTGGAKVGISALFRVPSVFAGASRLSVTESVPSSTARTPGF
jgi:hypothetical protein